MQTTHSAHPQGSMDLHPQIPPEPQPQSPSAESTESNLRSSLNLNPSQSGMESSNKRISQLTSISTTSSLEPYNDVTLSTLESKSYLGDDSLPPNNDTIPTSNQTQIESNLTGSSSNSDPVKVVGGHLPGRLQVGNGHQDQGGAEAVGRSSHDGVVSTKESNDLISRFVRKATSSNSLKGKGSNVERQTHPSVSSSSSPKDPPSKLQQPTLPYPSSSSNPSDDHHQSRNLTNGEDTNQSSNLRSRQVGTSDTDFSVISSRMGSTSQSIYSQGSEEGLRSRGMDRPHDDRSQGNHRRDATITRKSVEKSRSLEKRRLQEQQQLHQSSSSQMMTVPSSNPGGSSSSLGATSIASSGGGHVFGGLGIDEEIKRHLSIESSTSSNPSASSNKEKTPSRTASIFRPLGKAFRKKTKGKEKERDKGKESMTTDGEDENMITGGWKEDDGENLLISRPHPGFLSDGVISPTSLDGRRLAQNELDAFNLSGDHISPTSTSQQQQQQQQHHPSRISVERSSGSASGSAASNFGGDISGSGTGTAATSVSGDQMPRKSLNLNNSRTSSDLDNSYSRFGSDGRNSQDLSRNVNLGRQGGAYFTSSEDDADEEEASERDQRSNANANGRKKKVENQDREEVLNSSSSEYRSRKFSSSRPSPPKAGDQGSLSNQHSDSSPRSDPISPEWSKQSLPSSQNSTSSVLQSQSSKGQLAPHSPLNTRASLGTSRPSEKAILGAGPGSRSVSGPSSVSSGGSGEKNGSNSGGGRMAAFSKFLSPKDEDENEFPASTIPTSSAIMGMGSFMNPVYPTTSRDLKESDSKSSGFRSISRKSLKKAQLQTIADAANQSERELLSSSNEMSPTTIKSLADEQEETAAALQKPRRSIFNLGLSRKPSVSIGNGSKFTAPQPLVLDPNREAQSPLQRDFSPSPSPMSTSPRASIDQSSPIIGARRARRRPRTSGGEISTNSGDSWNSFGITKTGGNGASRSRKVSVTSGGAGSDKELLDSPTKPFASASSPRGSDFGNDRRRNPRSRRDSVVSLDRPRTSTGFKDSETFPSSSSSSITTSKIDSGGGAAALFGSPRQRASSLLPVFNFGRNRSPSNGNLPSPSGISPTTVASSDSPIQSHNNPLSAIAASIAANDVEAMESMRRSSTTVDSGHQRGGVGPNGSNPLFLQTQTVGLLSASPASSVPPSPSPSTSAAGGSGDPSPSNTSESPATTSFFPSNAIDPFQSNLKKKTDSSILAPGPKESAGAYAKRVAKSIPRADVAANLSLSSDDFASSALRSHMRKYLFAGNPLDIALRKLLMDMRLPKETQQIDRVMEAFAKRYMECNDGLFASEDQPYILAFSLMMLHTDAFNKNAKNKMSKSDYLKNTSSSGVAPEILEYLYDNLILAEFIYVDDSSDLQRRLTDSESPLTPNVFNAISGGVPGSSTKSRIDPYHIIVSGRTSQFRPEIENIIPEDSPYQPTGSIDYDVEDLRKCFLAAPWIEIATSRPSIPTGSAWAGTDYPTTAMISSFMANEPPEQFVTLKITKADLVSRKDDVVEGSKKARSRKWAQCGMLLTSAQLLFFKDTTWVHALSMQIAKQHREAEMVGQNISRGFPIQPRVTAFKPDLVISLSDAVAVRDATYSKYDHVFRLVVNQNSELHGRQYLIQADSQADVDDWIAKINYRAAFRSMGIEIRGLSTDKAKAGGGSSDNGSLSSPPLGPTPSSPESAKFDSYRPSLSSSASSVRSGVWQRRLNSRKALLEPKLNQARENLVKISREVEDEMRLARHLSILTPFQKSTRDRIEAAAVPLARRLKIRRLMFAQASSIVDVLAADLAHTEEELQTSSGMSTMEITSQQMELALKAPASQLGTPQLIEMGGSAEQQDFDALFGAAAAAAAASNANSSGLDTPLSTGSGTPSVSRRGSARRSQRSQYPPPSRSTRASASNRPPAPAPAPTSSLPSLPSLSLSESGLKIESSLLTRSTEAGQQTPKRSSSEAAGEDGSNFNMPSSRPEESSFLSMPSGYDSSASDSPVFSRFTRDLPALPSEPIDRKGKSREAEAARSSSEAEHNFGHADTYRSDSDVEPDPSAWLKIRAGDPEPNLNSEQLQRVSPQEQAQET